MSTKTIRSRFVLVLAGCISIFAVSLFSANAQLNCPETISVLQNAYRGEILAYRTYTAYAKKANSEDYPSIAQLFRALAASESIHARNFMKLLSELGAGMKESPKQEIEVSTTKKNLKHATQVELKEIDKSYPGFLERIKPEEHEASIQNIMYAWESEKQHRELIKQIQSGTGIFFGVLAKKIEGAPDHYFVCQQCGSTLVELPKDNCPICKGSVSQYKELERINHDREKSGVRS
jgi:rubrerythrin